MLDVEKQVRPVLIVGGGAAGIWLAAWLAVRGVTSVDIVEPRTALGRGLAYSTPEPGHLLNVTPNKIDIFPVPGFEGFVSWLAKKRHLTTEAYHSRSLFGDYMEDTAAEIQRRIGLTHHRDRAISIAHRHGRYVVELECGQTIDAHCVVLAVGNLAPQRIAQGVTDARIIEDPWTIRTENIAGIRRAIVAGTGLTAIDVIVSLIRSSPDIRVTLAARRPFIPPVDILTEAWSDAANVPMLPPAKVWSWAMNEIRRGSGDAHWVSVFEGLKTHAQKVWRFWTPAQRATFVRHGLRYWLHHRHRAPLPSYRLLKRLHAEGKVQIERGRIDDVRLDPSGVRVSIDGRENVFDILVNATGPSLNPYESPFLTTALERRLITADPLGMGIAVGEDGEAIGSNGLFTKNLWILGAWTRGSMLEAGPMPLLRKHAERISAAIVASLKP